mmetsp:Transcript_23012/g.52787  ORF Transcript_23012/g.52787 Transcript_23012/m.52787 type:complete len:237 (+) Transcript_23012:1784-2494(+)
MLEIAGARVSLNPANINGVPLASKDTAVKTAVKVRLQSTIKKALGKVSMLPSGALLGAVMTYSCPMPHSIMATQSAKTHTHKWMILLTMDSLALISSLDVFARGAASSVRTATPTHTTKLPISHQKFGLFNSSMCSTTCVGPPGPAGLFPRFTKGRSLPSVVNSAASGSALLDSPVRVTNPRAECTTASKISHLVNILLCGCQLLEQGLDRNGGEERYRMYNATPAFQPGATERMT